MLLDEQQREVTTFPLDLNAGESVDIGPFHIIPQEGAVLMAEVSSQIEFFARETDSGDPFVSLSSPLDLSGYSPGVAIKYDLRAIASDDLTGRFRGVTWVGVRYKGGSAQWF